jgi:hypothetical protein
VVVATPPAGSAASVTAYSVQNSPTNYEEEIQRLQEAEANQQFRENMQNVLEPTEEIIQQVAPLADPCKQSQTVTVATCPASDCKIDVIFSIDASGSMGDDINNVRSGVIGMMNIINQVANASYRFGLNLFGGSSSHGGQIVSATRATDWQRGEDLIALSTATCGNASDVATKLTNPLTGGPIQVSGSREPWHLRMRDVATNYADRWKFRGDADVKILMVLTDERYNNYETEHPGESVYAVALDSSERLAACGVRLALIWTGSPTFGVIGTEYQRLIDANEGSILVVDPGGQNIISKMTSYLLTLCAEATTPAECEGADNKIVNGTFDVGIAGWTEETPTVSWDSSTKEMKLTDGAQAEQLITGLTPGDLVFIAANLRTEGAGGAFCFGIAGDSQCQWAGPNMDVERRSVSTQVPASGEVTVWFRSGRPGASGPAASFLDDIVVCVYKQDDCGPGQRNAILNPNFETGVQYWTDAAGVDLTPADPEFWDESLQAIIINISGAPEVRTEVTGMRVGTNMTLDFELTQFEPAVVQEMELIYGVKTTGGATIVENSLLRRDVTVTPDRYQLTFAAPAADAIIYFKGGAISGEVKIRNVLLCEQSGICDTDYSKLSFDDFETSRGGWSGGTHDTVNKYITLAAAGGDDTLSQTFVGLAAGTEIQLAFSSLTGAAGVGRYLIEAHSGSVIDQFFTNDQAGQKSFEFIVQGDPITVIITNLAANAGYIDDILVCTKDPSDCDGSITGLRAFIEWNGIPRRPVNFFNAAVRYLIRDFDDPTITSEVTHLSTTEGHLGLQTCDLWKQQGSGGAAHSNVLSRGITQLDVDNADTGELMSIVGKADWLWSIPQDPGTAGQDSLTINFPTPPAGLIERVTIFLLVNILTPSGDDTAPAAPPPLDCSPDPGQSFDVIIGYTNSQNLTREFRATVLQNSLYTQTDDFEQHLPNTWDENVPLDYGINGTTARWETVAFDLDLTNGAGLDQCTIPTDFAAVGEGILNLPDFNVSSSGIAVDSCLAVVEVTEGATGVVANEIQSITLPGPTGGTYDISLDFRSLPGTVTLDWNATADDLRAALGTLPSLESPNNLRVTGTGRQDDPFLVEFINDMGGANIPLLEADGANLTGSATAFVTGEFDGTYDERQTISNTGLILNDLVLSFNGVEAAPVLYNASLDSVQAALEGINLIGAGNIRVTGNTTDREAEYTGPWRVDFIGTLANQNVSELVASPNGYEVITNWNGGPTGGRNESQIATVGALSGRWRLEVYDPNNPTNSAITWPLPVDATASRIQNGLVNAASFLNDADVVVEELTRDTENSFYEWRITFAGQYARRNVPLMTIDSSSLVGSNILVTEATRGSGDSEVQIVTVRDASGGAYKLRVRVGDQSELTQKIIWNTTAPGLQQILNALALWGGVTNATSVVDLGDGGDPSVNGRFEVTFLKRFGDIPLMEGIFQESLLCDPLILPHVDGGPYPYVLPCRDDISDISCQSGGLLLKPCDSDGAVVVVEACCDANTIPDAVNVATQMLFERDLFDPNDAACCNGDYLTVQDLAVNKGLDPTEYTPYLRSFETNALTATTYSQAVDVGQSVVLIENELDTANGRTRVLSHLAGHREILPSRMYWPTEGF